MFITADGLGNLAKKVRIHILDKDNNIVIEHIEPLEAMVVASEMLKLAARILQNQKP